MKKIISLWLNLLLIAGVVMVLASSCSKSDENTDNPSQGGTVKDIDGNVYHTVTIGTQVWMLENLKVSKYRNGDPIPNVTEDNEWNNLTTGAQCDYEHNNTIGNKFGKLYNWYAVTDSRNIAPTGWHVPSAEDIYTLGTYVGSNLGTSGTFAKALAAKTDWMLDVDAGKPGNDISTNNSSRFSALPGGYRLFDGTFHTLGAFGIWWTTTELNTDKIYVVSFGYSYSYHYPSDVNRIYYKENGFSVRCVKD